MWLQDKILWYPPFTSLLHVLPLPNLKQNLWEKFAWEKSGPGPGSKDKRPLQKKFCQWTVSILKDKNYVKEYILFRFFAYFGKFELHKSVYIFVASLSNVFSLESWQQIKDKESHQCHSELRVFVCFFWSRMQNKWI